jgi:hypothetical protein
MKTWFPILTLFVSNILLLFFAATGQIGFFSTILIYWFQSCIIGLFHFIKMLNAKNVEVKKGLKPRINGVLVDQSGFFKKGEEHLFYPFFFLFHYGIFHLVYGVFILSFPLMLMLSSVFGEVSVSFPSEIGFFTGPLLLISIASYFIHHFVSFKLNFDSKKKITFPNYMFYPYPRIIPMHAIIVSGFGLLMSGFSITNLLLIFIVLKTGADISMHLFEHKSDYAKSWLKVTTIVLVFFLVFGIIFAVLFSFSNNNPVVPEKNIYDAINDCYSQDFPEKCFADLAIERNDDSLCKKMGPISWKYSNDANELIDICYNFIAQETENQEKCKLIQDLDYRQYCIEELIYEKAVETKNPQLCETITHPGIKQSCINKTN